MLTLSIIRAKDRLRTNECGAFFHMNTNAFSKASRYR